MGDRVRSLVPARMDRLPWSRFHWRVVIALGITWVLEGVEIGLAGAITGVLSDPANRGATLHVDAGDVGLAGSAYLVGEVVGALYFGRLADKLGRRRLFIVTLALYLIANGLTAFAFAPWYFFATRFLAGLGIGGEYAAIHSAIDELSPARYRGRVDIAIAGTYWGGAMIAAGAQMLLFDPNVIAVDWGWRVALLLGPLIGFSIWPLRRHLPESPRWRLAHGRAREAEATVAAIEDELRGRGVALADVDDARAVVIESRPSPSLLHVLRVLARDYRSRFVLGLTLMITQSGLYNAIFFSYAVILQRAYGVSSDRTYLYIFPFAAGNLLGALGLGRLFDTVGRRKMIAATYCGSAVLLAVTGGLFAAGALSATTQTVLWCAIFFIASAGASAAYLTVSEIFPVDMRGAAISVIFAIAQLGGAAGAAVFGRIVTAATSEVTVNGAVTVVLDHPAALAWGYAGAAAVMFAGGTVAWFLGIDAEQRSLEDIAPPVGL